jgi:ribose 5-phosphate isomerase B
MTIAIGNDYTATALKNDLIEHLTQQGHELTDLKPETNFQYNPQYPATAEKVANAVASGQYDRGILLCGTGVGMCLAANKVRGIRAVVCSAPYSAQLSREHNDANILCIGARVVGSEMAKMIADMWLGAEFIGGRHKERMDMIAEIERRNFK